ncbi:MAG: AMP-binding protein, partial [Pseudoxanthomonas sp.]|nr:AMP-binding protein [Pseudoxanthomonas sp.]
FGTVGRPLRGNQIVVAEDGAIRVSGPGLFQGYLDEKTRTSGDAENFFLTGDLGHLSTDGYLTLTGRTGDLIKTSTGRRIAPAGVEAQLRQVPGIDEAVLIGTGRNYLVALCTSSAPKLDEESRMKLAERISIQISQLGTHERPRGIALLHRPFSIEQGELTPNLKIRHSAVEDKHAALINSIYQKIDGSPATPDGQVIVI